MDHLLWVVLREKCPNKEFFWTVFSLIGTDYEDSVFSPNARKYGPEKTPYLDTFHAVLMNGRQKNVESFSTYDSRFFHLLFL